MATTSDFEALFYPGTKTLKNKYDERDPARLADRERDITSFIATDLKKNPIQGNFDLEHMRKIHQRLFDPIYEWAGQIRTFNLMKQRPDGLVTEFARPNEIQDLNKQLQKIMTDTANFKNVSSTDFPAKVSEVYQIINEMHPFREGNGRSHRIYLDALAANAGHQLDFTKVSKDAWNYAASMSGKLHLGQGGDRLDGRTDELKKVFSHISGPAIKQSSFSLGRLNPFQKQKQVMQLKDLNPVLSNKMQRGR